MNRKRNGLVDVEGLRSECKVLRHRRGKSLLMCLISSMVCFWAISGPIEGVLEDW